MRKRDLPVEYAELADSVFADVPGARKTAYEYAIEGDALILTYVDTGHVTRLERDMGRQRRLDAERSLASDVYAHRHRHATFDDAAVAELRERLGEKEGLGRHAGDVASVSVRVEDGGRALAVSFAMVPGSRLSIGDMRIAKRDTLTSHAEVARVIREVSRARAELGDAAKGEAVAAARAYAAAHKGDFDLPDGVIDFVGDWTRRVIGNVSRDASAVQGPDEAEPRPTVSDERDGKVDVRLPNGTEVTVDVASMSGTGFCGTTQKAIDRWDAIMEYKPQYERIVAGLRGCAGVTYRSENWNFRNLTAYVRIDGRERYGSVEEDHDLAASADLTDPRQVGALIRRIADYERAVREEERRREEMAASSDLVGDVIADAVLETVRANDGVTANTIVKLLRGLKVREDREYAPTCYAGRMSPVPEGDIRRVIEGLKESGALDERTEVGDWGYFHPIHAGKTLDAMLGAIRDGRENGFGKDCELAHVGTYGNEPGDGATEDLIYLMDHPAVFCAADGARSWLMALGDDDKESLALSLRLEQDRARKSYLRLLDNAARGKEPAKRTRAKTRQKPKGHDDPASGADFVRREIGGESRWVIIDGEGRVIDDAQGYGYRSIERAKRAWAHKPHRTSGGKKENKRAVAREWLRMNRDVEESLEIMRFDAMKDRVNVTKRDVDAVLTGHGIDPASLPFPSGYLI